jgi:hypothetical protein
MRVYIARRTNGPSFPIYEFTKITKYALFWDAAMKWGLEQIRLAIAQEGITVDHPFGGRESCTDFRIEQRPEGGLLISCELPI